MVEKLIVRENIFGGFMMIIGVPMTFSGHIIEHLLGLLMVACSGYYILRYYELEKNKKAMIL